MPWADRAAVLALALLVLLLTGLFYAVAFRAEVRADDRVRGLFIGFQSLEGEETGAPYRWSKGEGMVCLPAPGLARPAAGLRLRLLGSGLSGIDRADLRVGALTLPLAVAPESRSYTLLLPPADAGGPLCATLSSATADPSGTGRVAGVGLRSVELWNLAAALPPPAQLFVNLWLAVGGYWLLRRLGPRPRLVFPLVVAVAVLVGGGLLTGRIRLAPDLPFWSGFVAGALALMLAALLGYQIAAPRLRAWQRETLGVLLLAALLGTGWSLLARLEGFVWPFPLMARGGTAFGLGVLPAVALFAALAAVQIRWLRAAAPPPAQLAIGVAVLAAALLPATLKVGLRGWESLFQHFAVQEGNYIEDLPRVGDAPLGFLRNYVALMPELALHNKTHPPGGTLFLWAVDRFIWPGPEAATFLVLALAALGAWPTYRLAAALLGPRAAPLAAAIYALLPAFMIFAATAMDAMFATLLAWAIFWIYAALVVHDRPAGGRDGPPGRLYTAAAAAGVWIALGLCFSFTTLMLGLLVLGLIARRLALGPRRPADAARWLATGGVMAGTTLLLLGLLYLATGYNSVAAFFTGVANNRLDVSARVSPLGLSSYLFFLAVNAVAFGCYLGPWLLYRLGRGGHEALLRTGAGINRPADSLGLGMAALLLGMLGSGLFYREIERVWLFTHPLIAGVLADGIMQEQERRTPVLLAALMLLSLFVHSVIFRAALRVSW